MNEQQHKAWWPLHLRVVLGEPLSAAEQSVYEAGRAELQAEERAALRHDVAEARALQTQLRELTARERLLEQQESSLREQAAQLEQRYLSLTGEPLGLEV
jgi:predicted RNase H-like nuclease (RuvC/YqgF family)